MAKQRALGGGGAVAPLEYLVRVQTSVDAMWHDSLTQIKGEFLVVEEDAIQELKFQRQFKNCIQSCVKLAYSVDPTMRQSRLPIRCNFSRSTTLRSTSTARYFVSIMMGSSRYACGAKPLQKDEIPWANLDNAVGYEVVFSRGTGGTNFRFGHKKTHHFWCVS